MSRNLRSWRRRWLPRFPLPLQPRHPWSKQLLLEALEDRTLLSVTVLNSFAGLDYVQSRGYEPPDTQGAAGPSSTVEVVNQAIAIFTPGGATTASDGLANFWTVQGGLSRADSNSYLFDPEMTYDPYIQRFIVGDEDVDGFFTGGLANPKGVYDIAVSKSSDPTTLTAANWNFFQISTTPSSESGYFPDFPGNLGYNADALVFDLNMFDENGDAHVQINSINVNALANGTPLTEGVNAFQNDYNGFSLRPTAMQDSATGDPMWFVTEHDNTSMDVVKMTNVLSTTPTLTTTNLGVNPYSIAVAPLQPNGNPLTPSSGDGTPDSRYVNASEENNLLVTAQQVSDSAGNLDEVQWYEINLAGGTPTMQQQGDVSGGPGTYDMFPGIAINASGDIGLDYIASGTGAGQYLSVYATGRTPGDPVGQMQTPVLVQAGATNYTGSPPREGDLSGINVDSSGNFWSFNEYTTNASIYNWGTSVGHFSVSSSGSTSIYTVTSTADDGSAGTLRAAINAVNSGHDNEIDFKIPGSGARTIQLTSALPAITASGVFINGLSQGGSGNTTPLIELSGTSAGSGSNGLLLSGADCVVSGLLIESFGGNGIEVSGAGNTIGGTAAGAGNVISGNGNDGILIDAFSGGNQVQGNHVGTDAAGASILANVVGVEIVGANNTVGGPAPRAGNVISGNSMDGVLIDNRATGVAVQGNRIGTNAAGSSALANGIGVEVQGSNNTIGGTAAGDGNQISGNVGDGVRIDSGVAGVAVDSNYVGTNYNGTSAVANGNGVEVQSSNNSIGGTGAGQHNVISGNTGDGVLIDDGASSVVVQDDFLGTNVTGTGSVANGVGIEVNSSNNTIGGSAFAARNVISGNGGDGVRIDAGITGVVVQGNYVGTDHTGTNAVANLNGIDVQNANNTIGGTIAGARNVLSGNSNDGLLIEIGASGVAVLGNYVGLNVAGKAAIGNHNGIELASNVNTIGGTIAGARNVISGNNGQGVVIDSGVSGIAVQGNFIGTNVGAGGAVANGGNGVEIAGTNNTVGGTIAGARNILSGNGYNGVLIDSGGSGNVVQGDFIGTNAVGTTIIGNAVNGVEVAGVRATVGGSVSAAHNVISGNGSDGVLIDSGGSGATVQGNFIGTNAAGSAAFGNRLNGVEVIGNGALIGGTAGNARNVISGSGNDGVLIDSGTSGVQVQGDYVGINVAGTLALSNGTGVEIAGTNNTIGGTALAARNVVSGNSGDGIVIDSTGSGNAVQGNFIGTNRTGVTALSNGGHGVSVAGNNNSFGGSIGAAGNTIAFNTQGGVNVSGGSGDTIRWNSIFSNGSSQTGPGITESSGANNNLASPTLSSAALNSTTLTITGTFTAPTANATYVLEFFANPTGDVEGKVFLGRLTLKPTKSGTVSFAFTTTTSVTGTNPLITSTLTDASGATSAFSNGVTRT